MIEADTIISLVVTLVIMAVGLFAFSTVMQSLPSSNEDINKTVQEVFNSTDGVTITVFNLLPVVVIVAIVGFVMMMVGGFTRGGSWDDDDYVPPKTEDESKESEHWTMTVPQKESSPLSQIFGNEPIKLDEQPKPKKELSEEKLKEMLDKGEITSEEYNERMIKIWFQKK